MASLREHPLVTSLVAASLVTVIGVGLGRLLPDKPIVGLALLAMGVVGLTTFLLYLFWPTIRRLAGVTVFSVAEMEKLDSLRARVDRATTIDGLFLAGRALFELDDAVLRGRIRHFAFPDDNTEQLRRLSRFSVSDDAELASSIRFSSGRALSPGLSGTGVAPDVIWLSEFPEFTLLFVDADSPGGYVQIEPLFEGVQPGDRLVVRIRKKKHPESFAVLWGVFNDLRKGGKAPPNELLPGP